MPETTPVGSSPRGTYASGANFPKPRRRLLRTLLHRPRRLEQFAPRLDFNLNDDESDPATAAQWGEHLLLEDWLLVLHRDGSTSSRRHVASRLHSSEALAQWDEVVRSYDSRTQSIHVLAANLYLPDGTQSTAQTHEFRMQLPGGRANQYGRALQLNFSPLRPGVVLEFEERFEDFSRGDFIPAIWEDFYLETCAPCRRRRFTVAVAKPFALHYNVHHGAPEPTTTAQGDYAVYVWDVRDAPGIELDEWTPPFRDFAPWVDVSTSDCWAPFAEKFRDELVPGRDLPVDVRKLSRELTSECTNSLDKAQAAYTYVARTVRYGRPLRESEDRNARASNQVFQDLQGDCKDKSALLVQLLRALDLPAQVAVVLTADAGRTDFLPSTRFNHAIVKTVIDGHEHWLDPASGEFAFGELPPVDQEIRALVLDFEEFDFESVPSAKESAYLERRQCEGRLDEHGDYQGKFEICLTGEMAAQLRTQLMDRDAEHRDKVLQTWLGSDYAGATGSEFAYRQTDLLAGQAEVRCQAVIPQIARRIQKILLLQAPWAAPLTMTGPLAVEQRRHPLALQRSYRGLERHSIDLPAGVHPIAVPDPVQLEKPWGQYACTWESSPGRLVCQRELCLQRALVPSEQFAEFKAFWRQASSADATPLVLQQD